MELLTEQQVREMLTGLNNWGVEAGKLIKRFAFADFAAALSFINRVGAVAEEVGHHPDMHNSYSTVVLELSTHDAGGITKKDFELAQKIDKLGL